MNECNSSDTINLYNQNYFLNAVDGFEEYSKFNGEFSNLFERYQKNINLLDLSSNHNYLEFGCGRGEVCIYHALQGGESTGIDYSEDAINMAIDKARSIGVNVNFISSSFSDVNLKENSYDRILASEFIEHISAEEGLKFAKIAYKALRPGGKILIFTYPNTIQRKVGYPILRAIKFLQGITLPKMQPDTVDDHYRLYHLNEQNYFSLKKLLLAAEFKEIEAGYDFSLSAETGFIKKMALKIIESTFLRHLFFKNLYAIAHK